MTDTQRNVSIGLLAFVIGVVGAVSFKSVKRIGALEEVNYVLLQRIADNEKEIEMLKERVKLVEYNRR